MIDEDLRRLNRLRFALIELRLDRGLTQAEEAELERLGREVDALVDQVAPLPQLPE